jgi:RNA polymerase sigma-70 factor (ECF subfamily)
MNPPAAAEIQQATASDASLVAATLTGERRAFSELICRYERAARATCVATIRDQHLASDAAQEAFVSAFKNLKRLRDPSRFGPWLLTICRHEAARLAKKQHPDMPLPIALPANDRPTPDHSDLLAAVAALPEQERAVVTLRYFGGHDVSEIAAILDRPVGTVTKQLSRAYERLRKEQP